MEPARPAWGSSWQVRHLAGEPSAVIRVRNLQATMAIGRDAWGREHKIQPVLISAEVFLREPFGLAAFADQVSADTVHYGLLSKAILATLESSNASHSIFFVLERVWQRLTGMDFRGCRDSAAFLDISTIRYLSITIHLPKASLLGDGVSMTSSATFRDEAAVRGSVSPLEFVSCSVRLHELRVPTLVGVNDNERSTKQEVVADIEIEKFAHEFDQYSGLESLVVKVVRSPFRFGDTC